MGSDNRQSEYESIISRIDYAAALYHGGHVEEAMSAFYKIQPEIKDSSVVNNYIFLCHALKGGEKWAAMDVDGSIVHFEKANKALPGHTQIITNLVILYNTKGGDLLSQGKVDEALSLFERAYALAPDNAIVKSHLFTCHFRKGLMAIEATDYVEAIERFEHTYALAPENPQARRTLLLLYNQRATHLCGQGLIEEARPFLTRVLDLDPDNAAATTCLFTYHFLQSIDLLRREEAGAAIAHLERMSALGRTQAIQKQELVNHIYHRALAYYIKREYADAAHYFKIALSIPIGGHEVDGGVLHNCCIFFSLCAHNLDQFDEFVEFCKKNFLGLERKSETDAWMAAVCRHAAAIMFDYVYYADCIPFFKRLLEIVKVDIACQNQLGIAYLAVGDLVSAIRQFKRSMIQGGSQGEAPYRLAQVLSLLKGKEAAARFCRHVLKSYPGNILVTKELASTAQTPSVPVDFQYYPFPTYRADRSVWLPPAGRPARKLRVLCLGPCQGFGVSRFLDRLLNSVGEANILYVSTGQHHLCKLYIEKYARHADVVVYRKLTSSTAPPEEQEAYAALNAEVRGDTVMVSYPAMENWSLWPINIFADRVDTSRSVKKLLRAENDMQAICRAYDAGTLDFEFSRRYRDSMAILKFTERHTDVKLHDYINENIKHEILFTFGKHPAKSLYLECVRQVYRKLYEAGTVKAKLPKTTTLFDDWPYDIIHPVEFFPIDMYSKEHFGFTWCTDEQIRRGTGYYHMLLHLTKSFLVSSAAET